MAATAETASETMRAPHRAETTRTSHQAHVAPAHEKADAPTEGGRIFTRSFCLLFAANLIVTSVYFLLITTMAYYAVQRFGVGDATAGITASIFLIAAVVARTVTAPLNRRFSLRQLALASLVLQLASCILYFAGSAGIGLLIAVRFIHGFSFGIANTVIPAMAVESIPAGRMGEGTGYFMLSSSLGLGIGPLMSVLVAMGLDYSVLFAICTVLSAVALVAVLPVGRGAAPVRSRKEAAAVSSSGGLARIVGAFVDTSTVKVSLFMFLVAFSYSSLNAFINSYANDLGMAFFAPFVFLVYSVTLLLTRPVSGKLMDRFGENAVLYPSILSMAVGLALAACVSNPPMLLLCGVFMATGFGTSMSVGQAVVIKRTKRNSAMAIATFFLLNDAGCGLGPFLLGFVVGARGYSAMYWLCALVALTALVFYHFAHGRTAKASYRELDRRKMAAWECEGEETPSAE